MGKELDILAILDENTALKTTLAEYKVVFAKMEEKITKLEQLVASYQVKKDSHNSSLPPSTDLVKPNQSLRPKKSERKRGGQIGHKGSSLKMSDTPDELIVIEPQFCNKCGNDLSDIGSIFDSRRQVIEIPPVNPLYIEYRSFKKICTCGHSQVSHYPETVTNHIQYGASVQAIIAYESVRQYTPFKRLREKLSFLYKLDLSEGTIRNILHSMALKASPVYDFIQTQVGKASVVGGDETGVKVGGQKHWAWVYQTKLMTFIAILASRGQDAVRELFGRGFENAVLVSDRWQVQLNTFAKGHQLCMSHLLRDLNYLIEFEKTPWAQKILELFLKALDLKKQTDGYYGPNPKVLEIEQSLDALLLENLDQEKQHKTYVFQKAILKNREYLFQFLYYPDVPPDNNASERAVRNLKVKQKVSGQFNGGQQDFAVLRSVIDTIIKLQGNLFQTLLLIANYKPDPIVAE